MTLDEPEIPRPSIVTLEAIEHYGRFAIEPLERGFGTTLGNPLRRVLLSSLTGTAVTWIKIDGVLHEYSVIPHIKEEVLELILNVKAIRLRSQTDRPGKLRLEVQGEGEVKAGDIVASADFEVANPDLHLATLDSPEATLSVEFNVEQGKGYLPAKHDDGLPIGVLPVDAIFGPVRKVNYTVERTRVGQVTDYERLLLEVWTDGTISAVEAVRRAAQILVEHFFLFSNAGRAEEPGGEQRGLALAIPAEQYNMPIEQLGLSSRTLNCLKRANINKTGEVLERDASELRKIRNFGEKSLEELYQQLEEHGLMPKPADASPDDVSPEAAEDSLEEEALAVPGAGSAEEELR